MSRRSGVTPALLAATERQSLGDQVTEQLRTAVLTGSLGPDDLLGEDWLAAQLGVSRGPIREALQHLEREGLVSRDRNRTARVARLTRADVEEIFSLRLALERLAVSQALRTNPREVATQMRSALADMEKAVGQGLTEYESCSLDIAFHDIAYQLGGHERLRASWAVIKPQVQLSLLARARAKDDFAGRLVSTHTELVEVMERGDLDAALAAVEAHIHASYERVVASFPAGESPGATVPVPSRRRADSGGGSPRGATATPSSL